MLKIISRDAAKMAGAKRFFTGDPCNSGHIAERYVSMGRCCECAAARCRGWSDKNRPRLNEYRRRVYQEDPQKHQERSRKFREKRPELTKIRNEIWAAANPKRRAEINAAWRSRNREHLKQLEAKRRAEKPEILKQERRNSRAMRHRAPGSHTAADIARIRAAQKGKCGYCRGSLKKMGEHVDHITPLARGGSNDPANLQLLCPSCNSRKSARDPLEFANRLGMLL